MPTTVSYPAIARPLSIAPLGRMRLVLGAAALGVIAVAAAWQWSWLVAIGAVPLLLSVAPCAAKCGLGLCMHRMGNRSCGTAPQGGQAVRETLETPSAETPSATQEA
jgi:hypothetical protein